MQKGDLLRPWAQVGRIRKGRVRLRPNRGFPLGLAQQGQPPEFWFELFHATSQGRRIFVVTHALMAAKHGRDRLERLPRVGDVAGEGDGRPGSEVRLRPTAPGLPAWPRPRRSPPQILARLISRQPANGVSSRCAFSVQVVINSNDCWTSLA